MDATHGEFVNSTSFHIYVLCDSGLPQYYIIHKAVPLEKGTFLVLQWFI